MKKILIIYPHWYPANLAGVQRPRLIGNFLTELGWKPRVLTVEASYYEEPPDTNFKRTFSQDFEVTRVKAFNVTKPRVVGDIGLRAFVQLYKKAKRIISEEAIDFIWLPIPSFYNALLGRLLYEKTKVPYGIDYIDPWVRDISNQKNRRAVLSQWIARILEPIAIKKASLISGVSTPYYEPAIQRSFPTFFNQNGCLVSEINNPHTGHKMAHVSMPYGFAPQDHEVLLDHLKFPWDSSTHQKIWLYAGAFLPNSHKLLHSFFKTISRLRTNGQWDESIRLWFIGTGPYPAKSIQSYAQDHGLSDIVQEHRDRYPFLHILNFLSAADTVMIIGSTEKHYTASKTYQSLLSKRPVVSVFHHESSAIQVMKDCHADQYTVSYRPEMSESQLLQAYESVLLKRLKTDKWTPNLKGLDKYSAKESARKLVETIEKIIKK